MIDRSSDPVTRRDTAPPQGQIKIHSAMLMVVVVVVVVVIVVMVMVVMEAVVSLK